jgi:hypothetical protein
MIKFVHLVYAYKLGAAVVVIAYRYDNLLFQKHDPRCKILGSVANIRLIEDKRPNMVPYLSHYCIYLREL